MATTNVAELRKQAKLPAKQAGGSTVAKFFEVNKASIQAVLPRHVSPERMLKIALGALRTTPKLMECTTESLFGAVVQCAQLGLEPNTPMGHAYLIPFRNTQKNRTDVQVIIGYRGLIDLARRSGQIVSIAAHAVHENDEFSYEYGLEEKLVHRPAEGDRGEITHFYAVAKLKDGGHAFEVMSRAEVEKIRDNSNNYKFARDKRKTVWGQYFSEMGRKTVIRRLFKYLPVSIEMATASALDAKASAGEDQQLDAVLEGDYQVLDEDAPDLEGAGQDMDEGGDEWPQLIDGKGWVDSAGEIYDGTRHAWSKADDRPAVRADGTFRARRGTGKQTVSGDDAGPGTDGGSATAGEENTGAPGLTLESLVERMRAAQTEDELNEVFDMARDLPEQDRNAAESFYDARMKQILDGDDGTSGLE